MKTRAMSLFLVISAVALGTPSRAEAGPSPHTSYSLAPGELGLIVAPKLGLLAPTSKLGATLQLGLEVGYRLPMLADFLSVAVELTYARPAHSASPDSASLGGTYDFELRQRILALSFDVLATLPLPLLDVYGGAGYGIYLLKAEVDAFDQTNSQAQTRAGLQLRGGAGLPLGLGQLFGEVRYHYTNLRYRITGEANAGGVGLSAGYRISF